MSKESALERKFQRDLIKEIKELLPGCIVMKTDPSQIQGFPDILILWHDTWAVLEGKRISSSSRRPNQEYWIDTLSAMSFAAFIYPENKKEVLDELYTTLTS